MKNLFEILRNEGKPKTFGALDIIKNIGPGLLVTVGFIDPGNWASNFAAGSSYGYVLLWVVTLSTAAVLILLFTNSYKRIERLIITFVSMIGLSFIYELFLVKIDWPAAMQGWVINSAMIILAATTFFSSHQVVDDLSQAQALLTPLLGNNAANIFAIALLLAAYQVPSPVVWLRVVSSRACLASSIMPRMHIPLWVSVSRWAWLCSSSSSLAIPSRACFIRRWY